MTLIIIYLYAYAMNYPDQWTICKLQIVTNAFMVLLSFLWGMYFDILARMCTFWLIFKRWSSQFLTILNNTCDYWADPSPKFIWRTLLDLVKRWDILLLDFKDLFWNDVKNVKASFSSLLNTRSIVAPQEKG